MQTYIIEGVEYTHPDIHYIGEFVDTPNHGHWFELVEEGHTYRGLIFGVSDVRFINEGEVEYDIMLLDESININDVSDMIDNFVNIMISTYGDNDENTST